MKTALDEFEQMLITAAEQLKPQTEHPRAKRRRRVPPWRRLSGLTGIAWIAVGVSAIAAASGVSAYLLWLDRVGPAQTLASFECVTSRNEISVTGAITGSPLTDCAASWPSATGGRSNAPALSAWVATSSGPTGLSALVQPTAWGKPAPTRLRRPGGASIVVGWRPLPSTWTVDLGIVALNDQLKTVTSGVSEVPTSCERPGQAVQIVRSLLAADHLEGWHVLLQATHGSVLQACLPTEASVEGGVKTVKLLQSARSNSRSTHETPAGRALDQTLVSAQRRISSTLAHRCVSVSQAAAAWTALAARDGLHQNTLARERAVNAVPPSVPAQLEEVYTLVEQPATQNTGRCAHVLVMQAGGGEIVVYAARIAP